MPAASLSRQLLYAGLLFVLILLLVPRSGHDYDVSFWVNWATYMAAHGLGNTYQQADNTYNPVYQYVLWCYGRLAGSADNITYYRHWLKVFTLAFDFAGAFWAASLVPERHRRLDLMLLLVLNFGYLYNSVVWQQIDTIYTFFAFGAVVLAAQRRPVGSALCYVLALATKTQAIIFLPPLLLLWGPQWGLRPAQLLRAAAAAAGLALLVLSPFIWAGDTNYLPRILAFNLDVTQVFPVLSMSAYNLWHLLVRGQPLQSVPDTLPFAGLTYHAWGLLLFCLFSGLALLPLLLLAVQRLRSAGRADQPLTLPLALLGSGLIPLFFAFFNTQMHERYWHACMLFLAAYGFLRRSYWPYVLASVAYFLNLEDVLRFLGLRDYESAPFSPPFVASLFGLAGLLGLLHLYRLMPWRSTWQAIRQGRAAYPATPPVGPPAAAVVAQPG